jgi:general secretion pathway protein G
MNRQISKIDKMGQSMKRGFTLIELMVVILILAILAALIVPKVMGRTGQAKIAAAKSDEAALDTALKSFHLDCDRYPTTEEGLNALRTPPSGLEGKYKGPYLDKDVPLDPWGNPYQYQCPGSSGSDSYTITSYGADGVAGGDGDNADIVDAQ